MNEPDQQTILKRAALGRVAMSREQREALLDEFERSGLNGAQFARAAGVCYPTFAAWVRRRSANGDSQIIAQNAFNINLPKKSTAETGYLAFFIFSKKYLQWSEFCLNREAHGDRQSICGQQLNIHKN